MPSYYDLVQEQKGNPLTTQPDVRTNQSDLDKRMAADAELLRLAQYKVTDDNNKAIPGIINVTLNRPAVFAANVISSLGAARQQVIVESEDSKVDTHLIEDFLDTAMAAADRRLWKRGLPLLNPFADVQFCIRGRSARRVLLRKDGDQVIPDIMPWDGRYVYHEQGEEGLAWAAYETIRTRDVIEAEYGPEAAAKVHNLEASVLDVWDDQRNEVWIDGYQVMEQPHSYGVCPVVFQIVSLGYGQMLLDRNWSKHDGESIFFMIRDIVPELNRLTSILQTLNMNQLKAALQYKNPQGSPTDEPPDRPELADVVSVGPGSLEPINLGEARVAAQMMYQIMEKAFQEGSYTDIDIGNVQQPFSAVALITIGENKDMVYMPRLAAKELLNKATAEMLVQQALQIGGSIALGRPGHKKTYSTSKLQGEYDINYKYFVKSPKLDIARMSLAEAAAKWYPREFILSEVLQVEDPDGVARDWYSQEAEMVSPGVKQHRIIMSLLDKAEDNNDEVAAREAQIMANELGLSIDQMKMGVMPKPAAPSPSRPTVPLLPEGGRTGGIGPPISNPQQMPGPPATMPKEQTGG